MTMPGGFGPDWTSGLAKDSELSKRFNLRTLMRRPKRATPSESIIEGVTHDSIADFVEASNAAKQAAKNPLTFGERVRRRFRRKV